MFVSIYKVWEGKGRVWNLIHIYQLGVWGLGNKKSEYSIYKIQSTIVAESVFVFTGLQILDSLCHFAICVSATALLQITRKHIFDKNT